MEDKICVICGEPITYDDYYVDDSNTYDGLCHASCYEEAQGSRLGEEEQ